MKTVNNINFYKNVTTGELFCHSWTGVVGCNIRINEQLYRNNIRMTANNFQNNKDFIYAVNFLLKPCIKIKKRVYERDVKRYQKALTKINNTVIAKAHGENK